MTRTVTLCHRAAGSYDPATGIAADPTETQEEASGAMRGFRAVEVDGETVKAGDGRVLLSPATLTSAPKVEDHVLVGSDRWGIVAVRTFEVSGEVVAYDCHVRRAA